MRQHHSHCRRLRLALLVFTLLLAAAACAAPEPTGEGSPAEQTGGTEAAADTGGTGEGSDEPILFGANIELSGGASVQGQAYANALNLLAEQINEDGGILGRPIEVTIEDNGTDQTEAVTITRSLAEEGVVAMIGPGTSPTTLAAMDTILELGIPTISMGSADAIVEPVEERPNVFKTPQTATLAAQGIVDHMAANGLASPGLIAINNPYGDAGIDAMTAVTESAGMDLVGIERFEADDPDTSPQLNNLVSAGADAIVTWAIPPGAPTVRRNAVQNLGIELPMYFDAGAGAELFLELAGESANGALMIHPKSLVWDEVPEDDPQYDVLQEFGQSYTETYDEISGFAGYAWDALGLYRAAIEESGDASSEGVISGLESLGAYTGVTGTYEISDSDHVGLGEGDLIMLTVADGEWTTAEDG